ncbi:MAG: hypothetical protein KJO43_04335 [Phycisphaerae bacterium]|nr:hypothetical protein [Phycisphaerae bacterium]
MDGAHNCLWSDRFWRVVGILAGVLASMTTVGAIGPPNTASLPNRTVQALVDRLVSHDIDGRSEGWDLGQRIANLGVEAAPALEAALAECQPASRRRVVWTLESIDGYEPGERFDEAVALCVGEAVAELRHDAQRWNAIRAMTFLHRHEELAEPHLEAALRSDDHQQRQLAAHLLRRSSTYVPSPRMLNVTVEGLSDDVFPSGRRDDELRGSCVPVQNAVGAVRWFLRTPVRISEARAPLARALGSADTQQQFLAAYLLGRGGQVEGWQQTAAVLIPHLGDNDIRGDANMAAAALYGLGPRVVPLLRARLDRADWQEEALILLIIHHLRGPTDLDAEVPAYETRRQITGRVRDPIVDHRFVTVPWRTVRRSRGWAGTATRPSE